MLGLGLDPCTRICTSMWQGDHVNQVQKMTLALGPEKDYDWWFKNQTLNRTNYMNPSVLAFNNKTVMTERGHGDKVILKGDNN